MTKILLFIALVLSTGSASYCQKKPITRLYVGDQMPNLELRNVHQFAKKNARITDFKGKLLLLDFWSTRCSACIAGFTKMERYQEQFGDKIQILLVNPVSSKDDEAGIAKALARREQNTGRKMTLPHVNMEPLLEQYIPYEFLPRHVWISGDGKILAITDGSSTTDKNIELALQGQTAQIKSRKDILTHNRDKPLFADGNITEFSPLPLYRSMFNKEINGLSVALGRFSTLENGQYMYSWINCPLLDFYLIHFELYPDYKAENQWIYQLSDPTRKNLLDPSNNICYELVTPKTLTLEEVRKYAKQDALRAFSLNLYNDKKKMRVYVLKPGSSIEKLKAKASKDESFEGQFGKMYKKSFAKNAPFKILTTAMIHYCPVPIINETGFTDKDKIDIYFPDDIVNYDTLQIKKWLESIGMVVSEEEREMPVIVVTDQQ